MTRVMLNALTIQSLCYSKLESDVELENEVEASGASSAERDPVAAPGEPGPAVSFTSHVPGMGAKGKSHVAVNTIPWPTQHQN
jgi:hypothetical protein